ncbi:MAG: threonylcarbamoyl-AMP synthase [Lachnospiraceae bacterium]|nr:threonylcarbamoyl-AMP synthase [Lachnospiraceae bacterium]
MRTEVIAIASKDDEELKRAGAVIRAGGLVAFPTETVYGLGGNALDADASRRIYAAKGRPSDNPLIVHISDFSQVYMLADEVPETAKRLADAFWPGPLTMILKKAELVPETTTGGLSTVALRMPNHPAALGLIEQAGVPIAAPSANRSGRPSPTTAAHVFEDMAGKIPMILDGGEVEIGVESTIVDLTGETPMVLRPGYISREMLEKVLGIQVELDPAIVVKPVTEPLTTEGTIHPEASNDDSGSFASNVVSEGSGSKQQNGESTLLKPKAPGMRYRHYAPKAPMILVKGPAQAVTAYICKQIEDNKDKKIGVLCSAQTAPVYKDASRVVVAGAQGDIVALAHNLYADLRDFDEGDIDRIYAEDFGIAEDANLKEALENRMMKAAGGHIVTVG